MRLEVADLLIGPSRQCDVCVIGAGPAGIALAHALAGSRLRVCVVESGGRARTALGDDLRVIESHGIPIRDDSRERVLGGTSTSWAGLSSPFDPIDFAPRPWVANSGWPLALSDLLPYYHRTSALFRFPSVGHFTGLDWLPIADGRIPPWSRLEPKTFLAADPAQNFGAEFAGVFDDPLVDVVLGATASELTGDRETGRASRVQLRASDGRSAFIEARAIVLAAGGIENARLLLASRFAHAGGLGNDHDQVGRYFMNHPKANYGRIELAAAQGPLPGYFGFLHPGLGYAGYVGLRLTEAEQERLGVLNSYVRFEPVFDWSDDPGVDALVRLVKRNASFMRLFRRANADDVVELRSYAETGDDPDTLDAAARGAGLTANLGIVLRHHQAVRRYVWARLRRSSALSVTSIRLRNFMEMAPDPSNRVTLSERLDALGSPVASVTHRCGELDRRSMVALHQTLAGEVADARWGRMDSDLATDASPWPIDKDASHHLGATRMGRNPATSVVDPNLRVHSAASVYVVGGSVFPTSGCANPTFTIVALALRLGEHLRKVLAPA